MLKPSLCIATLIALAPLVIRSAPVRADDVPNGNDAPPLSATDAQSGGLSAGSAQQRFTRQYVCLRDLYNLPFKEMATTRSDYGWILAGFTPDGQTRLAQKFVEYGKGNLTLEAVDDNENGGFFFEGAVDTKHIFGYSAPIAVKKYRVQIRIITVRVTDSTNHDHNLPFLTGGEAVAKIRPNRDGRNRFSDVYILPEGFSTYIADAVARVKSDRFLKQSLQEPGDVGKEGAEKTAYVAHMASLLGGRNPLVAVMAYKALRQVGAEAAYKPVIEKRRNGSQGMELALYELLLLCEGDPCKAAYGAKPIAPEPIAARIRQTTNPADLYRLALAIRTVGGYAFDMTDLLEKVRKQVENIEASRVRVGRSQDSVAQKYVPMLDAVLPVPVPRPVDW